MTKQRDPLGKRALFSDAPPQQLPERHHPHAFDLTVHCSSCDETRTMSASHVVVQHLPFWAWVPIPGRKHAHLMRCPACGRLTWLSISLAR